MSQEQDEVTQGVWEGPLEGFRGPRKGLQDNGNAKKSESRHGWNILLCLRLATLRAASPPTSSV